MTYTQEDLATLRAMKMSLLQGKRVVRSEVAGKTLEFQAVKIADLDAAIAAAEAELGTVPLRTYAKNGGSASC